MDTPIKIETVDNIYGEISDIPFNNHTDNISKRHIMIVFGTRPETIKMCPLILKLKECNKFKITICFTGQHQDIALPIFKLFNITPDINLNIMTHNQTLHSISIKLLQEIEHVYNNYKPHLVLVHGDTTTSFIATLSAYYLQIPVGHVEAGLRTNNIYQPFPEEINRQIIDKIAILHFSPTAYSSQNLISENLSDIYTVGNTIVDAIYYILEYNRNNTQITSKSNKTNILVTCHRRENWGTPLINICLAINKLSELNNVTINFLTHPNQIVQKTITENINNKINILHHIDYNESIELICNSDIILTDSGGIQEEACTLGIPTLVLRNICERQEGVDIGILKLIGTSTQNIITETTLIINNLKNIKKKNTNIVNNIYGNGNTSQLITDILISSELF
jgi:UDP-N-acetylglucosamine 2-epimerase (non-hydrolysing)